MGDTKKAVLTIEFDNEDLLADFAGWMSDGGGEWSFMEGMEASKDIKVEFKYHTENETLPINDPKRYGPFLFGKEKKFVVKVR